MHIGLFRIDTAIVATWRVLTLSLLCVSLAGPAEAAEAPSPHSRFLALYGGLLQAHTQDGTIESIKGQVVNYSAWGKDPRHAEAVALLAELQPGSEEQEQQAFWLNAYNLLTIQLVLREQVQTTLQERMTTSYNAMQAVTWTVAGKERSLHDMLHSIILPMQRPELLFGLCNSAISGPDISAEPYRADTLETQLKAQIAAYLQNELKGMRVEGETIVISPLFRDYGAVFGGPEGALQFIRRYDERVQPFMTIRGFLPYIWTLNSVKHHLLSPDTPLPRRGSLYQYKNPYPDI